MRLILQIDAASTVKQLQAHTERYGTDTIMDCLARAAVTHWSYEQWLDCRLNHPRLYYYWSTYYGFEPRHKNR